MLKLIKNWYKRFVVLLLIPLIVLVVVAPFALARISISGEGILSLESRVALAVNNPPASEAIEESRVAGIYETDWGYEYVLAGGDSVEVGDKDSVDFKPSIKLNRWGGESFIKIQMAGDIEGEVEYELEDGKVKTKYKIKYGDFELEVETEFYSLEPTTVIAKDKDGNDVEFEQNELGGFEFEVILQEKPATNQIVLNIETQELKFYYQPKLTPEEIAGGSIQPDNVVGSYAVYHATRTPFHKSKADANKYKVGKAFHIYRPKITDADGNWIWGELSLDEKASTLTTTIPQSFLDSAVYPVSTGTTNFGYEEIGANNEAIAADMIRGSVFTSPGDAEGAPVASITFHSAFVPSPPGNAKALLVNAETKIILANGISGALSIPGQPRDWRVFTFSTPPIISANTNYVLAVIPEENQLNYSYDSTTGILFWDNTNDYTTPTDPTDGGTETGKYSIYATYEEEAAVPEAEVAPITWEAGILEVNATANTAINYFTVTNTGSGAIDIEIRGTDATGGDDTWDLADNGTPGENIFGLYAGLDDDDDLFDIIIKEDAAYNTLVAGLAEDATQDWGIKLYMPTSVPGYDGQEMTIIVTLIISAS